MGLQVLSLEIGPFRLLGFWFMYGDDVECSALTEELFDSVILGELLWNHRLHC